MNPDRWEQITASFALNEKPLSSLANSAKGNGKLSKGKKGDTKESGKSNVQCSNTANQREGSVVVNNKERSEYFNHNEDINASEEEIQEHGDLAETGDIQGKLIENLYRILKDKSEKIKVQEQAIQALNGRLQGSAKDVRKCYKEHKGISADDESKGLKVYNPDNEDTLEGMPMLKQIAIKVEHVEKRLDTIINCMQRKFPKTFIEIEEGKEGQRESVIFSKPWDKSPALFPKPTNGSLMREIHCRRRFNNKSESLEENKFLRKNHSVFQQHRPIFSSFSGLSNEDDIEQRMQALERLVVLLKRKIMTRINSKRKHRKT